MDFTWTFTRLIQINWQVRQLGSSVSCKQDELGIELPTLQSMHNLLYHQCLSHSWRLCRILTRNSDVSDNILCDCMVWWFLSWNLLEFGKMKSWAKEGKSSDHLTVIGSSVWSWLLLTAVLYMWISHPLKHLSSFSSLQCFRLPQGHTQLALGSVLLGLLCVIRLGILVMLHRMWITKDLPLHLPFKGQSDNWLSLCNAPPYSSYNTFYYKSISGRASTPVTLIIHFDNKRRGRLWQNSFVNYIISDYNSFRCDQGSDRGEGGSAACRHFIIKKPTLFLFHLYWEHCRGS